MSSLADEGRDHRITFARVVRSEWTKLSSLRSTWMVFGGVAVLAVGLAGVFGYGHGQQIRDGETVPSTADAVSAALLPLDLLALVVAVLGVLQMSGEYGSGLIRATLAAVPGRLPVLWAKAAVLAALTVVVMLGVCVGSLLLSQGVAGSDDASLGDPTVLRATCGAAFSVAMTALIGLGIGSMLRHTAGAITVLVVVLLIVPSLLGAVPWENVRDAIEPYLPALAGQAIYQVGDSGGPFETFSPGLSAVVLAGWAFLSLACGGAVLYRRDA
jgi:ABC-2 type transport system permease protein